LRLNARYRAAYEADETPQKAFASRDRHCDEEQKSVCVKYVEEKFFRKNKQQHFRELGGDYNKNYSLSSLFSL